MKRKLLVTLAVLLVLVILLVVVVPLLADAERFRPTIESRLSAALGRRVQIGHLAFSWLAGGVSAADLAVADDPAFSSQPFLTAKALDVNVAILPLLLHRDLRINSLTVRQPQVRMIQASGRWNVSGLGATPAPAAAASVPGAAASTAASLALKKFSISDGQLILQQAGATQTYSDLNFAAKDVSLDASFPFTFSAELPGKGKLKLDGRAGPMPRGDLAQMPIDAKIKIEALGLAAYGGRNSTVDGTAGLQAVVRSDGHAVRLEGSGDVEKLVLAKGGTPMSHPVRLDFAADYKLQSQQGKLTRGDVRIDKSLAQLAGTFETRGSSTGVNLKLISQGLQATDIEQVLRSLAFALPGGASLRGGAANANLALAGPTNALVITGPVQVQNLTISGFNLGANVRTMAALAGIDTGPDTKVESLDAKVRVAPEGTRLDDISALIAGFGALTGSGTIAADKRLDFQLTARLNKSGGALGGLMQAAGVGQLGTVPFRIEGTTANPKFVPDLGSVVQRQRTTASDQAQPSPQPQNRLGGVLDQLLKKKKQ